MIKDPIRDRTRRVAEAMLEMKKLEIARLEEAYGTPTSTGDRRRVGELEKVSL
jgi:hypothetical protein